MQDPPTEFVEWLLVLVRGRRGPRQFAKALPSEDGEEYSGEEKPRINCMWGRPIGYQWSYWTRSLDLVWAFPCEGLQQELLESEGFLISR